MCNGQQVVTLQGTRGSPATAPHNPGGTCACGGGGHSHHGEAAPSQAPSHGAQGAAAPMQVGETVRWVEESHDLDFPPVPFPSRRLFDTVGEAPLRALVRQHHLNLRTSEIGALFPGDDQVFAQAVEKIADFVVEACGGPARFTSVHGSACMRTRHYPFTIDEAARVTWLLNLWRAFYQTGFDETLREEYWNWMEPFTLRMVNRRTMRAQPARYPFATMQGLFNPPDRLIGGGETLAP